ncbi:MAG: class I adenylate-forming enzyme family protein [Mycoplasmatota bacterium]|nr:class I adenylate-forming enzyme family protein [Mycoplasmatota bacterium]
MKIEDLTKLKEKISQLSSEEKKLRDLYLRDISLGNICGPITGYASIDKPWLKYYEKIGITKEIPKVKAYDLIHNKYANNKELISLNYFGKKITYYEMFNNIEMVAKSLKKIGVQKGDIVLMALPTIPEMVYVFYALNRIGAIVDTVDPRIKSDRYKQIISETNAKYLFAIDMCYPTISSLLKEVDLSKVILTSATTSLPLPIKMLSLLKNKNRYKITDNKIIEWSDFIKLGQNYFGEVDCKYSADMPVVIVHTGGTTGEPKGVILTNENFNTMAITQEISGFNSQEKDKFLTFLPPFIAYCLVNAIHDPLYLGFENILIPKFDASDFPNLMYKYKPNHVLAGPILWDYFIKNKKIQKEDLSYLKSPISGGDVLNIELEREINNFFKQHNCNIPIASGYGLTEVSAAAIYSKSTAYKEGFVGIPYVKNNVSVFVPGTKEELPYNQEGEICISTKTLMKEYFNNRSATANIIKKLADGERWIYTGDLGIIDHDGSIKVSGRIKRLIVRNGNKIFPSDVENIILQNQLINRVSVVSMPSSEERNVPVAYLTIKPTGMGFENDIVDNIELAIRNKLPDFNVPVKYIFKLELPLTNINKIDFKKLEQESLKYLDSDKIILDYGIEDRKIKVRK